MEFNKATFLKYLGDHYRLESESSAEVNLELLEVSSIESDPASGEEKAESFSLLFRGPLDYVLSQQIYRLEHRAMGPFDILLVPVAMDENGLHYAAVFK